MFQPKLSSIVNPSQASSLSPPLFLLLLFWYEPTPPPPSECYLAALKTSWSLAHATGTINVRGHGDALSVGYRTMRSPQKRRSGSGFITQGVWTNHKPNTEPGVLTVSAQKATDMPNIAAAFAKLPQKIIWKHKGYKPASLGNNTLLVDWIPQNDLLGHPKTRLFVAHGGTNGIQEALYHGVPVVGIPVFFDQYDNLLRLKAREGLKYSHCLH
ncbi:hypothetical protein WMY93_013676 [Mugilogobius chulae]|uniref:UDP-glucuronosyltransferase n=1 Tax=Mugilogobius chulae TaxID=88201 RepID=A0AAW0P485_9GOBI